jgi:hypothetical protein
VTCRHFVILVALSFLCFPNKTAGQTGPQVRANSGSVRQEDPDSLDRLRSDAFKVPCLSALISPEKNATRLTQREFQDHAELRVRAAGLQPISWDACQAPDSRNWGPIAPQTLSRSFLGITAYIREDGTFSVNLDVFRVVTWRVPRIDATDDGYRAALLKIDSDSEPTYSLELHRTPTLQHEGRSAIVFDALDRLMDRFLVRYLRANQR